VREFFPSTHFFFFALELSNFFLVLIYLCMLLASLALIILILGVFILLSVRSRRGFFFRPGIFFCVAVQ
jgi:hypothetical protein